MIHLPRPAIGRRPLLMGAAGTAMALAARVPVQAQPAPPPRVRRPVRRQPVAPVGRAR